jgi:hypothetical protein
LEGSIDSFSSAGFADPTDPLGGPFAGLVAGLFFEGYIHRRSARDDRLEEGDA